jgi:hypothetical protein
MNIEIQGTNHEPTLSNVYATEIIKALLGSPFENNTDVTTVRSLTVSPEGVIHPFLRVFTSNVQSAENLINLLKKKVKRLESFNIEVVVVSNFYSRLK